LTVFLLAGHIGRAHADYVSVAADSNIYGAGLSSAPGPAGGGGGALPPSIAVGGPGFLTFQVSGLVSYNGGGNYYGADGGQYLGAVTDMDPYGNISGIYNGSRTFFQVGVFLNDQQPAGPIPSSQDTTDVSFASVSPALNQMFFIGDGLTGTGTGDQQLFYIPEGATQLYLGFADGNNFTGLPGTYGDDIGSLNVSFSVTATPAPPSLTLLGIGAACLLACMSRKLPGRLRLRAGRARA
jgi:hypothetical protein